MAMAMFPSSGKNSTVKGGQVNEPSPLCQSTAPAFPRGIPFHPRTTGSWGVRVGCLAGFLLSWPLLTLIAAHRGRGLCPLYCEGSGGSEWGRNLLVEMPGARAAGPEQTFLTCRSVQLSGLALFAETVWVTADQYHIYPLMGVSGKDDVFAGAWIAIFCGFSFFVVASFGVGAALCCRRSMVLTYLVLMLIVYIFECASCITSYTHRDYMVSSPSLITKQMLTFYSADTHQGQELTRLWDRVMIEQECCGTSGPMDWVNFTSAFREATPEVVFPWPPLCCRRTGNFIPLNKEGCRLGHMDYVFTKLPVMLIAMYFYTTL
ncbi:PREDICTED: uroplakin-1a isoform X2 [Cercocebus atys]|uniref:uroplakin-1a isoform X2 n=1 Tax=Cercocebus atys TaxID=9531 RepID=UPI0005F4F03E|nr:PREDICTED: uroplakin-1a isoform X2 [Cercocebus atys]